MRLLGVGDKVRVVLFGFSLVPSPPSPTYLCLVECLMKAYGYQFTVSFCLLDQGYNSILISKCSIHTTVSTF